MGANYRQCTDPRQRLQIDDLHLTDRYGDPAQHQGNTLNDTRDSAPAYPAEGRLYTPACIPVIDRWGGNPQTDHSFAADPYQNTGAMPLAGWVRYNAATETPQPMRTTLVIDVRSCDTTAAHCTTDREIGDLSGNSGIGATWMTELLGH
ncbi:hypothetical protein GCM10029992_44200 [Glycomyces albus]